MKKIFFIIIFTIISLPTFASVRSFLFPTYTTNNGTTIILDRMKGIYLFKPTSRELIFDVQGTTAKQLAEEHGTGTILVNAGYFGRGSDGYFPAGHTSTDPALIDHTWCERDPNLCGYIFTNTLSIHEKLTFTKEPTISAGPILMLSGIVNKEVQQPRSHRQRKTYRTLLIQTNKGPFFLVTKKQYALDRLLAYVVNTFGRSISVINLDGGSSTALRTDNPSFQLNTKKVLPTFFILK